MMTALPLIDSDSRKRTLARLKRIARDNGDLILTSRVDGTFYVVDRYSGFLVWPDTFGLFGTGASLIELCEFVGGRK